MAHSASSLDIAPSGKRAAVKPKKRPSKAALAPIATEASAIAEVPGTLVAAAKGSRSTPGAKAAVRRPNWLKSPELAAAMEEVRPQLRSLEGVPADELRQLTKARLRKEIEFMSNPAFLKPGAGEACFAEPLELAPRRTELGLAALRRSGIDLPIHLSRLCEAPLLNPEQERALFQRMNFLLQQAAMHRGLLDLERPSRKRLELIELLLALADWHRDRIVESNLRLVFSIVKKFVNSSNQFDDLLSDGIVALIRAVEKFDFDRGFRFSTYATQVVRRNSYRTVVLNQKERQKMFCGLQELDVDISDEAKTSSIGEKRWHELRSRLALMLGDLDRREKFIIRARFSLGSHRKVHTLQALADRLGVSKERVRQLERRAMEKLRAMAGDIQLAELET